MKLFDPDEYPQFTILLTCIALLVVLGVGFLAGAYVLAWAYEFLFHVLPWPSHPFGDLFSHAKN